MKRLINAAICVLSLTLGAFGQTTETFDLATFQAPKGWDRQVGQDSIRFSIANGDDYCLVTLFRSVPGVGTPTQNFDTAWAAIVKNAVTVTSAPQMQPAESRGEWQVAGGFAQFEKSGDKGLALLYTATGYGKMVNALVLTNTQAYEAPLTAFLNSISFKKPEAAIQPQLPVGQNGANPSLTNNFWKKSQNRTGLLGYAGDFAGSFSNTYQFFDNNTYKFTTTGFQYAAPKWYLETEEGTYRVTGNTITVTPKKAVYSLHRLNKEDPPQRSGNLPLSKTTYNFEFWRHDDNWRLLLSPVDGSETKREGVFGFYRNGEAQRTYLYQLVNAKGELMR
jgi:hypothetical protein